jgi:3',5'-cyclic-AMP phosphodiesterase
LARELSEPAPDATVLVIHHPPISGHTHRVSAGTLAGVPVWVSPATGSHADVFATDGFRGHAAGGFTHVDILDEGEIVATFVPLTGRDEILYEVRASDSQLRPAV